MSKVKVLIISPGYHVEGTDVPVFDMGSVAIRYEDSRAVHSEIECLTDGCNQDEEYIIKFKVETWSRDRFDSLREHTGW